jgi:3',5'-cyclic AMP phosphodiesterase CpdA
MLIAQISDTHIPVRGSKTYNIAPMAENLARCIEHINNASPRPDLVLLTGDITNNGETEELDHAAALLVHLEIPYFVIPGNHDDRNAVQKTFVGQSCPVSEDDFINYVIDNYELRLIALDTTILGRSSGEICKVRAAWLNECLAENSEKPTIIFMHHPPVKCGVIETDVDCFNGEDRLGDVVEKYNNIEAIICGHIHTTIHTRWRGTVVSTAPSMGMQLLLDLNLERDEFILEDPAYQLHYWTEDKNLITHTVIVREIFTPYLFEKYLPIEDVF